MYYGENYPKSPDWDDEWGDRVTKLVFIGIDVYKDAITRSLDGALLTVEEMSGNWHVLPDPLPAF